MNNNTPTPAFDYDALPAKYAAIADITARRKAFLEDIVGFYKLNNRAIIIDNVEGPKCVYAPTQTSPGCAIGRCLPRESEALNYTGLIGSYLSEGRHLPDWMREMGVSFLQDMQSLHDNCSCWNESGLSEEGKSRVEWYKTNYNLT